MPKVLIPANLFRHVIFGEVAEFPDNSQAFIDVTFAERKLLNLLTLKNTYKSHNLDYKLMEI